MIPEEYAAWRTVYEEFRNEDGVSPHSGGSIGIGYDWEEYGLAATVVSVYFTCKKNHVVWLTSLAVGAAIEGNPYHAGKCDECQSVIDKLEELVPVISKEEVRKREYVKQVNIAKARARRL